MTSLTNLMVDLRRRLARPSADSSLTDTIATGLINDALDMISVEEPWEWLEASETINTSNGDSDYAVAAAARSTIAVIDPTAVVLKRLTIYDLEAMGAGTAAYVRFFAPYKNQIHVRPVPNTAIALTHRYVTTETALSSGSDTPLIPSVWDPAVTSLAAWLAELREGNLTQAQGHQAVYEKWLEKMRAEAPRLSKDTGGGMTS